MALIKEKKRKIRKLLIAVVLLAVLVPQHQSYADVAGIPTSPADLVTGALQKVNEIMLEGVGYVLKWAALTLESVVKPETQAVIINTFVVQESWKIIRDFVNMFFILFLIIMAFGTIFDSPKYSWRSGRPPILVTFLIAALLINFSLVIGQEVIKLGNGLASIFLKQIAGFGQDMANGFSIGKAIPGGEFKAEGLAMIANNSTKLLITGLFSIVFLVIALLAFLAALLFTIIRIPILWFLLIVSPIACVGYVLPTIRAQTFTKWGNALISWTFFLPVYLFFLMFAVMFIRRKNELAALSSAQGAALFTGPGGALSDLLFYVLTILFMVFGLKAAYSVGSFAANGAGKLMGGIEKGVKKYMPGAKYVRAIGAGAKATLERVKEEGLPGKLGALYEGGQAERQRAARFGERFQRALGFRESFAAQRKFVENSNKEYEAIKQQYDMGRIDIAAIKQGVVKHKASDPKGFAFRKMLGEVGQLDTVTTRDTLVALADNPFASADFIKNSSEKGKLSELPPSEIRAMAAAEGVYANIRTNVAARKQLYKHIQANASVASGLSQDQFDNAMSIFGGPKTAEGTAFLKEVGKIRPDLAATFVESYERAHPPPDRAAKLRLDVIASNITNAKDVGAMHKDVWNDPEFRQALFNEIESRRGRGNALRNYITNLSESIRESPDSTARKTDKQALVNTFVAAIGAIPLGTPPGTIPPPARPNIP